MIEAALELMRAYAPDTFRAGLLPFLSGGFVALLILAGLLVFAWRQRWFRGVGGGIVVLILSLVGLGVAAGIGALVAAPTWAEAGTRAFAAHAGRLGLLHDLGTALLIPAVRQYTRDGEDDDAMFALERRGGRIDLAVLATPDGRDRALAEGSLAGRVRAHFDLVARPVVLQKIGRFSPRTQAYVLAAIDDELAAVVAAYPDLLSALKPDALGVLSPASAAAQVANRFVSHHAPGHARALVRDRRLLPMTLVASGWLLLFGVCAVVGGITRRSGSGHGSGSGSRP